MAAKSYGWNYKRLQVDTNAGSMPASVYIQTGGELPWSPRFYIHTVRGAWTAIQCDADGAVLATGRGSTRKEARQRLVATLGLRETTPPPEE